MIIGPGQTVRIGIPLEQRPDGSWGGEWKEGDPPLQDGAFRMEDLSWQLGKYQFCTRHRGLWYADSDFSVGFGCGSPKWGAIPAPGSPDRRPWRGEFVELIRRACGAQREA